MKGRFRFKILAIIGFVGIVLFGLSAVVMWLWNYALAPSLQIGELSYWQAMALLVLSKIIFSSFKPRRHASGPPWFRGRGEKWKNMTNEERIAFRTKWKRYCDRRDEGEKEDKREN